MNVSRLPDANGKKHFVPADAVEDQVFEFLFKVVVEELPQCDDRLSLALQVAPTVGDLFAFLDEQERKEFCRIVFVPERGIVISGHEIKTINLKSSFTIVDGLDCDPASSAQGNRT